jgi:hypothetical protein
MVLLDPKAADLAGDRRGLDADADADPESQRRDIDWCWRRC